VHGVQSAVCTLKNHSTAGFKLKLNRRGISSRYRCVAESCQDLGERALLVVIQTSPVGVGAVLGVLAQPTKAKTPWDGAVGQVEA